MGEMVFSKKRLIKNMNDVLLIPKIKEFTEYYNNLVTTYIHDEEHVGKVIGREFVGIMERFSAWKTRRIYAALMEKDDKIGNCNTLACAFSEKLDELDIENYILFIACKHDYDIHMANVYRLSTKWFVCDGTLDGVIAEKGEPPRHMAIPVRDYFSQKDWKTIYEIGPIKQDGAKMQLTKVTSERYRDIVKIREQVHL